MKSGQKIKEAIECHLAGVVRGATTPTLGLLGLFSLCVNWLGQLLGRFSVRCEFNKPVDAASRIVEQAPKFQYAWGYTFYSKAGVESQNIQA